MDHRTPHDTNGVAPGGITDHYPLHAGKGSSTVTDTTADVTGSEDSKATPNTAAAQSGAATKDGQSDQDAKDTGKGFTPPESQEDLDRIIEARIARERAKYTGYEDLKAKAAKFDELEDAKKTDEQRSAERIARLESELTAQKLAGARVRIAAENGLDPDLLAGSTEDELTAHAEKLAEAIKKATADAAPTPTGARVPNAGRGTGSTSDSGDWIRNALSGH